MNYDWIKTRSVFDEVKPAIIDPLKGTEWSYQDLNIRAENLANYLQEQGIKRGDVVGVFAPNDVSIFDLLFACFKMGAIFLPMNWRLKPKEVSEITKDSGLKMIFYAKAHLERLAEVPKEIIHMEIDSKEYNTITDPTNHKPFKTVDVESNDIASLMYTSGSTAAPKGVKFTYASFVNNLINNVLTYKANSNFVTISTLPLFHVFGFNDQTLPILISGGTIVLLRYYDGEKFNALLEQYKPNFLTLTPTMYYGVLIAKNFKPDNFSNIDYMVQGGSSPLPNVQKKVNSMGYSIVNGYGLTEIPVCIVNTPQNAIKKPGSIGKPMMFVNVKFYDDDYNEVEQGEIGELAINCNQVTPGYWNRPDLTEEAFKDGYFLTGDLARMDEDGDIYIIDRKKELIITGGENVMPSKVERILAEHPLVLQCVVVGYDNPQYGESVSAAIVLAEDNPNYEKILDEYMREQLAGYKVPKLYMKLDELPLNSTTKPDKKLIKEWMNKKAIEENAFKDEIQ